MFVANSLKGSITGSLFRIILSVPLPVIRVIVLPFFVAYSLAFPVLRIGSQFITLPESLPCSLTSRKGAVVLLSITTKKKSSAMDTWHFFHFSTPLAEWIMEENIRKKMFY
jgi:hypothetical protein